MLVAEELTGFGDKIQHFLEDELFLVIFLCIPECLYVHVSTVI